MTVGGLSLSPPRGHYDATPATSILSTLAWAPSTAIAHVARQIVATFPPFDSATATAVLQSIPELILVLIRRLVQRVRLKRQEHVTSRLRPRHASGSVLEC